LAGQQENKMFSKSADQYARDGGERLDAVSRHESLAQSVRSAVHEHGEAGETGGILDTILQRLSAYIEKNVKLQRAVKSAMVYPIGVFDRRRRRHHLASLEGGSDFRDFVSWPRR